MTTHRARWWIVTATMVAMTLGVRERALADPVVCTTGIARAASKHLQGLEKAMQKCEDAKVRHRLRSTIDCSTDPLFDPIRTALLTKLFVAINVSCGGSNRACGDGDDQPLAPTGWGAVAQCPDLDGAGCLNPIANCTDVAQCLECMDRAAVAQDLHTTYGAFDASQFGTNSAINACQRAIGKATARYLEKRSKAMEACWEARLKGLHSNPCPSPGDGKAAAQIAKEEQRKTTTICRACGGPDRACGGGGDATPGAIGFASSCPAVKPLFPPGSCDGAILDATAIVGCVDCVSDFDSDCAGAASVPAIVGALPAACNPSPSTTTTSSTTTIATTSTTTSTTSTTTLITLPTTSTTSTTAGSTSSTTSSTTTTTSLASTTSSTSSSTTTTTLVVPSGMDLTTVISSGFCGHAYSDTAFTTSIKDLSCGGLDIGGGSAGTPENINPDGTTNRFAITGCVGSSCTLGAYTTAPAVNSADVDCTTTNCKFGSPLPIPVNGAPVCVVNTLSAPASGTLDISTGSTTNLSIQLTSAVSLTGNQSQPCPVCKNGSVPASGSPSSPATGLCDRGVRSGLACTSTNSQGLTRDCAPGGSDGSALAGTIPVNLGPLTTGISSKTSATGIFCTGNANQQQGTAGCFGASSCRSFKENGSAAGSMTPIGSSHAITLASTFCVPKTGSTLLDFASNLPGPGATTIAATAKLVP